jgi:hypothetical protein
MKTKIIKSDDSQMILSQSLSVFYLFGIVVLIIGIILGVVGPGSEYALILILAAILSVLGGIVLILLGGKRIITIDKNSREIIWSNQQHIKKGERRYSLDQIGKIVQTISMRRQTRSRSGATYLPHTDYTYHLYFNDGSTINLGSISKSFSSSVISTMRNEGGNIPSYIQAVANFLNIPIEEDAMGQKIATASAIGDIAGRILRK